MMVSTFCNDAFRHQNDADGKLISWQKIVIFLDLHKFLTVFLLFFFLLTVNRKEISLIFISDEIVIFIGVCLIICHRN